MDISLNQIFLFILAGSRITGMIMFNPILGRKNVPTIIQFGFSMSVALFAVNYMGDFDVMSLTTVEYMLAVLQGLAIGFVIGFITQMFLSVFQITGQMIDMQIGLSMASMYDPSTNINATITGNLLTAMYAMLFFVSNTHLALINVVVQSFQIVPVGTEVISSQIGVFFIELMTSILLYAVQLAIPLIITELIVEFAVGILMRLVPNINVFVVNLQVKIIVGVIVIITIIPSIGDFMLKIDTLMMEKISQALTMF
ncbi:flagellar biosynthetic protein FliR [Eubacteriaceae bacterium ES3]|nr:flagellar biosynthetic protein FliR [Eubacteriaceae bacterium ES3]